uniref:DUF2207 domain-containing protein n=1 Tax=Panagrolaimus superbus TaxID=310955 RepID=A0A914YM37_9BILA
MLAWKPYKYLVKDLIRYGFVHDHKIELRDKDYLSKVDQEKIEKIEEKVKPRLMISNGSLKSTKKFFADEKLDAGMDVQMQVINVMKQVGKIDENNWWIFWLILKIAFAIFMAWSIPGLILMAIDIAINFNSYFATLLTVIAAVGTMLYFIQSFKAKYITQTGREAPQERYTQLIDFHSNALKMNDKHRNDSKLANVITTSIASKVKAKFNIKIEKLSKSSVESKTIGVRKFFRLFPQAINDQPHSWRLFSEGIRDSLIRIKPEITSKYFEILKPQKENEEINVENTLIECEKLNQTFKIEMPTLTRKLLASILLKITEDAIASINDSEEKGEDSEEEEIPKEFIEAGTEINIDDSDSGNESDKEIKTEGRRYSQKKIDSLNENFTKWFQNKVDDIFEHEILHQFTKPLLTSFTKYIENAKPNTEKPNGFDEYLEENSDNKYSIEEKRKQ